jgi:phosphohistidine phosphatase
MHLLLIRHAHAGDRDPARWPDDTQRPLSDKGVKTQRKVSKALARFELVPTLVLTSPWLRAAQTAEILVETLGLGPPVASDALATVPELSRIQDYVGSQPPEAIVALVGHSPWMEELAAILLGGTAISMTIDFPKSGVMGIDLAGIESGAGTLRLFLRPKMA